MRFWKFFEKLTEVTVVYRLKIDLKDFFGKYLVLKNLALGFMDKMEHENEFFEFHGKSMHWIFLIFAWCYSGIMAKLVGKCG